jgi:cytochrome subunit of sulfide dehydrogenase
LDGANVGEESGADPRLETRQPLVRKPNSDPGSDIDTAAPSSASANQGPNVRVTIIVAAVAAATLSGATAQVADPDLARGLAATCTNCHGTTGVSLAGIPSLAGRNKDDLVHEMREFRDGARPGTIMPQLAKGYTDAQIESIGAWFAAQKAAK